MRWPRVKGILCEWEPPRPISLLFITEDQQVSFNCLVGPFGLPARLGVVSSADVLLDPQLGADILSQS